MGTEFCSSSLTYAKVNISGFFHKMAFSSFLSQNQEKCLRDLLIKANKENAERKEIVVRTASMRIQSTTISEE